jgi:hypothetical protein
MKITTLAERVVLLEGKKKSISIAQVKEVIRCVQKVCLRNGVDFYKGIRAMRETVI